MNHATRHGITMTARTLSALSLALVAPATVSAADPAGLGGIELAQLTVRERIVIRIPRLPLAPPPRDFAADRVPPLQWREKSAPRCIPVGVLAGAAITPDGDVDLVATDGRRLRAKLDDDCPTLTFYRGFYLKRAPDGMVCARRDPLRARSGARCEISRFRTLVARR